jgi:hypothetical protein
MTAYDSLFKKDFAMAKILKGCGKIIDPMHKIQDILRQYGRF